MSRSLSLSPFALSFRTVGLSLANVLALFTAAADATIYSTTSNRDGVIVNNPVPVVANANYNLPHSYVGVGNGNENRSLLGFDISSIGPSVASVSSVSLTLHIDPSQSTIAGSQVLHPEVHAILPTNTNWSKTDSSWTNRVRSTTTAWTGSGGLYTSGTDYASGLPLASATISSIPTTVVFNFSGDLTGLINDWLSGSNAGLLIFDNNPGSLTATYIGFYGSGNATVGNRPELSIDYTLIATPEPASCGLMSLGLLGLMAWWRRSGLPSCHA